MSPPVPTTVSGFPSGNPSVPSPSVTGGMSVTGWESWTSAMSPWGSCRGVIGRPVLRDEPRAGPVSPPLTVYWYVRPNRLVLVWVTTEALFSATVTVACDEVNSGPAAVAVPAF